MRTTNVLRSFSYYIDFQLLSVVLFPCRPDAHPVNQPKVSNCLRLLKVITGPPTHSVGGQYCFAVWRLSSSVTLHGGL